MLDKSVNEKVTEKWHFLDFAGSNLQDIQKWPSTLPALFCSRPQCLDKASLDKWLFAGENGFTRFLVQPAGRNRHDHQHHALRNIGLQWLKPHNKGWSDFRVKFSKCWRKEHGFHGFLYRKSKRNIMNSWEAQEKSQEKPHVFRSKTHRLHPAEIHLVCSRAWCICSCICWLKFNLGIWLPYDCHMIAIWLPYDFHALCKCKSH